MSAEDDELLREFLVESYEILERLDGDLVELEQDPTAQATIDSAFRGLHTLKGNAGMLGYENLQSVAHAGETLLGTVRSGEVRFSSAVADSVLATVDALRAILGDLEASGAETPRDYTKLLATLHELASGQGAEEEPAAAAAADERAEASAETVAEVPAAEAPAASQSAPVDVTPVLDVPADAELDDEDEDDFVHNAPVVELGVVRTSASASEAVLAEAEKILADAGMAVPPRVAPAGGDKPAAQAKDSVAASRIRVDVTVLDRLMNLVGELVLARNQILQNTNAEMGSAFIATTQRLNLVTTALQEGVMKTRMQPIGSVLSRFPRLVRDVAAGLGKDVRLELEGQDTELDRTIIEAISDPLTHLVRNSIDHGIESPEMRRQRGKPAEGVLLIRAFHEGGQVNIDIIDDGAGIDPEKIKRRALERGVLDPLQAASMSERELYNVIFYPGFSTAETVTNVSGRGVGMDVVKTNIERIGGRVDIQSGIGVGTTVRIKIPLTLAIIPALIVQARHDRYAIPQVSLLELVRLDGDVARRSIETFHGTSVYRLRGELLPLVQLNTLLWNEYANPAHVVAEDSSAVNIVVLKAGDQPFGLVVDAVNDTQEIVVKPLSKQLTGNSLFAGASILGDGKIALILDVLRIAQFSHVIDTAGERGLDDSNIGSVREKMTQVSNAILACKAGKHERLAIPLSAVTRLEVFPRSAVETAGDSEAVLDRGEILPLVWLADYLGGRSYDESDSFHVVVSTRGGRKVGFVVDEILDVVMEPLALQEGTGAGIIAGSAVMHGHVMELLDMQGLFSMLGYPAGEHDHDTHLQLAA